MIIKIKEFIVSYIKYYFIIRRENKDLKILSDHETIKLIREKKLSYSRYGDGEFKWILGIDQDSFQKKSKKLGQELKKVLESDNNNLLIGIPISLKTLKKNKLSSIRYWVCLYKDMNKKIKPLLNKNKIYGNSCVTRPYIDFKNINFSQKFDDLKSLWNDKKVLIVEGEYTKLGMNNDLFVNSFVKRLICPSKNAYDYIDKIEKKIVSLKEEFEICLIALGPTATVLASRLSNQGIQAIDIGHIDIEYEWFLNNASQKIPISGKYTNETSLKLIDKDLVSDIYLKQIIGKIGV